MLLFLYIFHLTSVFVCFLFVWMIFMNVEKCNWSVVVIVDHIKSIMFKWLSLVNTLPFFFSLYPNNNRWSGWLEMIENFFYLHFWHRNGTATEKFHFSTIFQLSFDLISIYLSHHSYQITINMSFVDVCLCVCHS